MKPGSRTSTSACVLALLLALGGCGGGSATRTTTASSATPGANGPGTATQTTPVQTTPTGSPIAGRALALAADPKGTLRYDKTRLAAKRGPVQIVLTNNSPLGHNVTVADSSGKVLGATPTFQGGTRTLTLNLAPGTYTFYCSVPGHRMAGMEGTLTVGS